MELLSKHKVVTLLKLEHNAGARWNGRAELVRHADGLRSFFFPGGCHVYPRSLEFRLNLFRIQKCSEDFERISSQKEFRQN